MSTATTNTPHHQPSLWPEMADGSIITQLDILFLTLSTLTLLHSITKKGIKSGTLTILYILLHTITLEHTSLFLGGTHCHASSTILPMITPCSSINSVLFYVPWLYTSIEGAARLNLHWAAYPFAVGLLQIGFGWCYELQGPTHNFWKWPDENGIIAESLEVLSSWSGYPPFAFLKDAQSQNEVATITAEGAFHVSHHAGQELRERVWGVPMFGPYFHFAYGFAWALGLSWNAGGGASAIHSKVTISLRRWVLAGLGAFVLFLPPIWITRFASDAMNISLVKGVPLSLALSVLPIWILSTKNQPLPTDSNNNDNTKGSLVQTSDVLLFGISALMHAFFVTFTWRAKEDTPSDLHLFIVCVSTVHLITQYYCCFIAGRQPKIKQV